jgi:hypothetical protein
MHVEYDVQRLGACVGGTGTSCPSNGNVCMAGQCGGADGGCSYVPLTGTACSDDNGCTTADTHISVAGKKFTRG